MSTQRASVATSRPHSMAARRDSLAERQIIPGPRAPKTAPPRISVFIRFAIDFAFGSRSNQHSIRIRFGVSIRIPRLAQQGHDLALALLPCDVEGPPAVNVSESHIGAPFEETLGDRGVAVVCRPMQS